MGETRSGLRTRRERQTQITDRGTDVLRCPHFASSRLVLASVPSRSINHTQSTTKLNRRGCRTISLPSLKGFFSLYRLTPLSQSLCFSLLINLQLLACSISSFFSPRSLFPSFLWLKNRSGANYINNCKVWKTPAKNGQTASIFSCTVHWLMSGAGHYMSRHRKCALSCLSCQYSVTHTKCHARHPLSFTQICHLNLQFIWTIRTCDMSPIGSALLQKALLKVFDKKKWPVFPSSMTRHVSVYVRACTCVSAYDETPRKELEARASQEERCVHNVFWTLEGPARPRCQPASRYRASSNGTDNGEADPHRQRVCRAGTKEGR